MSTIVAIWPTFHVPGVTKYQPLAIFNQKVKETVTNKTYLVSCIARLDNTVQVYVREMVLGSTGFVPDDGKHPKERLWFSYPIDSVSLEYEIFTSTAGMDS